MQRAWRRVEREGGVKERAWLGEGKEGQEGQEEREGKEARVGIGIGGGGVEWSSLGRCAVG